MVMNTSDYILIEKKIEDSKIYIDVKENGAIDAELSWNIKIKDEAGWIFESKYTKQKKFIIPIRHTGKQIIFVQARKKTKQMEHFRESIWWYSDEEKENYNHFLASFSDRNGLERQLPLARLQYPYQNIAVILEKEKCGKDVTQIIKKICPNLEIDRKSKSDSTLFLISEIPATQFSGYTVSFSGKTKYNGKFIYGQNDFDSHVSMNKIKNEIGYFCLFMGNEHGYEIVSDFFGTYPLYRYAGGAYDLVSNSYHLLVLIVKGLGLPLTLDSSKIIPYFVTGQRMLFEQLASHDTFIKEIKKIPIHFKCIIDWKNGITFHDSAIGKILKQNIKYNPLKYAYYIRKAIKEIINNIQIIDRDNRVETIVADVSGGKDSRVVLGALLNIHLRKKTFVYSKDVTEKKDKDAFIPLNHLHHLPYDTEMEIYEEVNVANKLLARRSICLGTFFSHAFPGSINSLSTEKAKRIRLTGAGGDMLLCPYFPMSFSNIAYDSIDSVVNSLSANYNNGIVEFSTIKNYITNILKEGLEETYGKTPYDKFNNYYLYFRNVFHFGPEVMLSAFELGEEKWTPLYSKSAFILRQMCSHKYNGIRIAIDLLMKLKPELLTIPFNSPDYNKELSALVNQKKYKRLYKLGGAELNVDDASWTTSQLKKTDNKKITFEQDIRDKNIINKKNYFDEYFYKLNYILHNNAELEKVAGIDLYFFLKRNSINKNISRDIHFFYNKILSVYDLQNMILN